jgi:hypothetical protein
MGMTFAAVGVDAFVLRHHADRLLQSFRENG